MIRPILAAVATAAVVSVAPAGAKRRPFPSMTPERTTPEQSDRVEAGLPVGATVVTQTLGRTHSGTVVGHRRTEASTHFVQVCGADGIARSVYPDDIVSVRL